MREARTTGAKNFFSESGRAKRLVGEPLNYPMRCFSFFPSRRRVSCWRSLAAVSCALFLTALSWAAAGAAPKTFDIPAGDAIDTLRRAAQQAGLDIMFPAESVRGVRTNAVRGELTVRAALDRMVAGTPLVVVQDADTGALAVTRRAAGTDAEAGADADADAARPNNARGAPADNDEPIVLSAFEVSTHQDRGYRAANSVSATRIAVPISELPMNVSAFTEEFIIDQRAYDLYDVVKYAGVHQDNVSQSGWVRYNLRGFTDTAIQRNGFRTGFRFIDTANVARVEVVKGPASLMYGQINPGGVINYVTKRPQARPEISLTGSVGTHGYSRVLFDATGPVPHTGDRLLYRAIAMYENVSEFSQLSDGTKRMFAPSLTWRITPKVTLNVEYENFERREPRTPSSLLIVYVDGRATLPYPGLPRDFSFTGESDYQRFFSQALTAELNAQLTDHLQFRAIFEQSEWNQWSRITGQAGTGILTPAQIDPFYPPAGSLPPAHAMFRRNRLDMHEADERTGQVELTGTYDVVGVRLQPLIGYRKNFYTNTRNRLATNTSLPPWDMRNPATWNRSVPFGLDALPLGSDQIGRNDNESYYAVLSASLLQDRLKLLGGYSHYEVHNAPTRNNLTGALTSPDSVREANVPQAGVLFKLTPEVSTFLSYSESFLANSSLLRVANVPTTPAAPSLGKGWEGGFKVELLNGRISGTLSAFELKVSPTSVFEVFGGTAPNGQPLFTDVQGGSQKSTGYEADLLFTVVDGFQLYLNYTQTDAVYAQHPTSAALTGTRLVGSPERTFNLWGKYTFPGGALKGLYVGGGLSYTGRFVSQAANPIVSLMPDYTTVDLAFGYPFRIAGRTWTADVTVKNLTDKFYYASASSFGPQRHGFFTVSTKF